VKTILLIDDDARLRMSFAEALRLHGYRILEASSATAGLEIARQQLPDLILTDIHMPGVDGQELLRQIRTDPELCNRQVVLITGSSESVTLRRGMEMGADDFLLKPVELGRLLRCIEARLARAQTNWRVEDRMLSQLRTTLHSTLPHEFFTPLAGIVGLANILRTNHEIPELERREIYNDLYFSGLRLHRSLRNYLEILDVQDAAAAKAHPPPPPLRPSAIRDQVQEGIRAAGERHNRAADISAHLEECSILIRASDLNLLVEELVDNACKFSRNGSPVTVNLTAQGVLTVTDVGRGMTPEEIGQIGAFQQFDRKTHEKQGLGLGLILVKKLAAKCGAEFSIESPACETTGTRVKVAFRPAGAPSGPLPEVAHAGGK
jgi:DNA-binding response OmpR family regulator/anti-sigma regulatory factor (Ser/Thr protein kinase)